MDVVGLGKRVRIYIGEHDKAVGHHDPLWETIFDVLRKEGAAGATMVRGVAGFGVHSKLRTARLADIVPDLPVIIEWIDGAERVERLLPRIRDLVGTGMITLEAVEIIKYSHRAPRPVPPDRVANVMTREVVAAHPDTPVSELVRMLLDRDFRSLPVVDADDHLVGIITNRDLVERGGLSARVELLEALGGLALERELAASTTQGRSAAEVMTRDVTRVAPDEPLDRAAHLMAQQRVKRLPVVDDTGRLIGILSRVDILRTMGEGYRTAASSQTPVAEGTARVVGELMRLDVPSVSVDAPLGEVLDAVTSTRLNRAVVIDSDRHVVGIVTDSELLAGLEPGAQTGLMAVLMGRGRALPDNKATARDVMRGPVLTVPSDTPVPQAVQRILEGKRKVLPITDADGRLVGIVDRADLLRAQ